MSAVVRKNGRELETRQHAFLPRTVEHSRDHQLMTLVEFRKSAVEAQVGRVLRAVVRIEIRRGVVGFAVGVIPKNRVVIAKAFLDFHNATLVKGGRRGGVLVILHDERIHKTSEWIRSTW